METMKPMTPMKPMQPMKPFAPIEEWWPRELGNPNTAGGQNDVRYAFFGDAQRLAVQSGGKTTIYDTGDLRIGGVAQQQNNNDSSVTFTSQNGDVQLKDLRITNDL